MADGRSLDAAGRLKAEVDVLANLVGQRTGAIAGVWIDPHKARIIALEIIAAGYRNGGIG